MAEVPEREKELEAETAAPKPVLESPASFLVAAAVTLALLAAFEIFYRSSTLQPKLLKSTYSHVTAKEDDYAKLGGDVIVTGDSRMFHGVVPSVMHDALKEATGRDYSAYNFGIPSGTTPIFYMAAHAAAHHRPPPKVFVLGVTPALFSCCDLVSTVGTGVAVRPGDVPGLVRASLFQNPEEAGSALAYGFFQLASARTEILASFRDFTVPPPVGFQDHGWNSMGGRVPAGTQDVRAKGRAAGYAGLMDKSKGAAVHSAPGMFVRLAIRELKAAGTKVVVIGTPQARQLDSYHDAAHTYFEYLEAVQRVTREEGVPFVDCNAPPGIESTDFIDGDHLAEPGAVVFTRYLAREVVAPLLAP